MFKSRQVSRNFWRTIGKGFACIGAAVGIIAIVLLLLAALGYLYTLFFAYPQWMLDEGDSSTSLLSHVYLGEVIVIGMIVGGFILYGLWHLLRNAWRDAMRRCK
jgi:small-conductance mechanosensitive channel